MFELKKLPYALDALEPYLSKNTLIHHHGKHHQAYCDKLNALLGDQAQGKTLEDIILNSEGAIFNNAAQVWNHSFYFDCLSPNSQTPHGQLKAALIAEFGSVDQFIEQFSQSAAALFGSGWCWLVYNPKNQSLEIVCTQNANTPMTSGLKAILTCDVWEHAYYLDTQNRRPLYIKNFFEIVNWEFCENQYLQAIETT